MALRIEDYSPTVQPFDCVLIERAKNGWIVRPMKSLESVSISAGPEMWVYQDMEKLTADLPNILTVLEQPKLVEQP